MLVSPKTDEGLSCMEKNFCTADFLPEEVIYSAFSHKIKITYAKQSFVTFIEYIT